MSAGLRVLHVTEAMGGGIATLIEAASRRQVDAGADVSVVFTRRPDTPSSDELARRFSPEVVLTELSSSSGASAALALVRFIHNAVRSDSFDAIHLHSSIAGAVGRLAIIGTGRRSTCVFYSPHGFAFLRQDRSWISRTATRWIEAFLARQGAGLIVTSGSEVGIAKRVLRAPRVDLVRTGVRSETVAVGEPRARQSPVTVTMAGRIAFQKAPWRFAALAEKLADRAQFVWVGDGPAELREQWLGGSPVRVTGWVSPEVLEELMSQTDIFLFPTLWEGFALSLAQAQAAGLPAVVSDVVGNRDAIHDGVTGFVCADDDELVQRTRQLIEDADLWRSMSEAAALWAREHLIDDTLGHDTISIYERELHAARASR